MHDLHPHWFVFLFIFLIKIELKDSFMVPVIYTQSGLESNEYGLDVRTSVTGDLMTLGIWLLYATDYTIDQIYKTEE